jgi:hypothetical protein
VVYRNATISDCVIKGNQFADCRPPEQTAPVANERPLFARNIYRNTERRDAQASFTITSARPRVTPHYEEIVVHSGDPGAVIEIETTG